VSIIKQFFILYLEIQSFNQVHSEPQIQNNTYMNEFLTTITGEKLSHDFSIPKDL
jgi:DNA-dependent RNA polymerase auxiliary subunit epsilon